MAGLKLDNVSMSYGDTPVLEGVSLEVADGSFHAMVGPSGSGKTTMLKLLAGFLEPDGGRILLDGHDMVGVPPERRDLGIVFQNYALFPHMTVGENVAFGLRMRGTKGPESRQKVANILELVGLSGLDGRYPDELSGGQQQRVALARALVVEPKALLLDEPLSALDRKIRQEMQVELRRIQREAGVTAIIVTHDQEEALALGDRLVVLDQGRIQQEGTPFEVYNRPRTPFVATFLGSANMISARQEPDTGEIRLSDGTTVTGVTLPAESHGVEKLTLSVRPECWLVLNDRDAPSGDGLLVDGEVEDIQQAGQTGTGRLLTPIGELMFTVLSPAILELQGRKRIRLWAKPDDIVVFGEITQLAH